eukprot:1989214-Prymnesium_polylepis.1
MHHCVTAVAIGSLVLGDKDDKERTDALNETCHVDLAELEGDDTTGGDVLYEVKVPSALTTSWSAGKGSAEKGGAPASCGHTYAFGNTEEKYRHMILGCRRRGRRRDEPLKHSTGKGYVQEFKGSDYDALVVKKSRVIPAIVEAQGGLTPHLVAHIGHLSRRAKGKGARDSTKYGRSRTSTRSFVVHHVQRISTAAQQYSARSVLRSIANGKRALAARGLTGGACHNAMGAA